MLVEARAVNPEVTWQRNKIFAFTGLIALSSKASNNATSLIDLITSRGGAARGAPQQAESTRALTKKRNS